MAKVEINRIKVALAETRRKNKWLAEQIGKDESTISQWCTNARQPSLENLMRIASVLDIDIRELLYSTKESA
ncbi:helix-turn-helix transcriptional regulator [Brumimicrobium aurantiacum]|uniref:XRE family transcriptional regulator n=1 Tax=Brumimicrobium aurantiacum TaxID=1737063 RepID=A0A3E1F1X9_9FLAO|nr:helix-turn-helix transcriptional regulator [Brumimicrobium aurantiacum]RFC55824.1 XRE family transcriptional regulator [Brumimicrobium aurantiacum]